MGIRMPGATSGLFDPKIVDQLIQAEKIPVESAKKRKEKVAGEKKEVESLQKIVNDFSTSLNGLKSKQDFVKMKIESSHPDIIDGVVQGYAMPGTYEFEVRGLAKTEKQLAYGFPDKDKTSVGFGFMTLEKEDGEELEVIVDPGSTLQDVANKINDANAGLKAMIINTKYEPDAYRLMVVSEKSGKESKIHIDEDTTYLEFKEQVTGRNLDVLFEDVPVTDLDNNLEELVDGVVFNVKRSEPGTRIQVNVTHDVDATTEKIRGFVDKYNELADFVHKQVTVDPETKKAGILSGDGSVRAIMRGLQGAIAGSINTGGKFSNLTEVGISTDPKTGRLNMDDSKVKNALAEDYDSVMALFIKSEKGSGVADRLANALTSIQDPSNGVLKSRLRGLDRIIQNQDKDIENRERAMEQKEEAIRRRFTSLEGQLSGLKQQGQFLSSKFGGGEGGGG